VIDSVECGTKIKGDKKGRLTAVSRTIYAIECVKESSFGGMMRTIGRLHGVKIGGGCNMRLQPCEEKTL
jgi:hypothetical protein